MSNETDLDWLARNVHVWPDNTPHVVLAGDELFEHGAMFCESHVVINAGTTWQPLIVYRQQWLDRRAELQNKPSWKGAPEWAEWLCQRDDGDWMWSDGYPTASTDSGWLGCFSRASAGVRLGGWRDTLEKRPEQLKPSIEEANRLAQELKPFTSIEDNQEQEMKQDNGWLESGELPPVGTVCEYTLGANAPWYQCEIKYVIRGDGVVMKRIPCGDEQYCGLLHRNPVSFRPIHTERELAIEDIKSILGLGGSFMDSAAAKLYDAGYRKESK